MRSLGGVQSALPAILLLSVYFSAQVPVEGRSFTISNNAFVKDGQNVRILSATMHHFRVHPKYWDDRLQRMQALGINAVDTYVPWNLHEPTRGNFRFDANSWTDIEAYIKLVQSKGLMMMLRIGPYICAEWDFGGLPAWMLTVNPTPKIRSSDPNFLSLVDKWWGVLLPRISHYLYSNGGPIVMIQIENEFGWYGDDQSYLQHLVDTARKHLGYNIILYTADQGKDWDALKKGSLKGNQIFTAIDGFPDYDYNAAFNNQAAFNAPGMSPKFTGEFYTTWFMEWGRKPPGTSPTWLTQKLQAIVDMGASVNVYVGHGGTSFGFYTGSNAKGDYGGEFKPETSSYDFVAPIGENGDTNRQLFYAIRSMFGSITGVTPPNPPALLPQVAFGTFRASSYSSLLDWASTQYAIFKQDPVSMEELNSSPSTAFALYQIKLPSWTSSAAKLTLTRMHDQAYVFVRRAAQSSVSKGKKRMPLHPSISEYLKDIVLPHVGEEAAGRNDLAASSTLPSAAANAVAVAAAAASAAMNTSTTGAAGVSSAAASKKFLSSRVFVGAINRWNPQSLSLSPASPRAGDVLEILVESMGRVDFGQYMFDHKGILGDVKLDSSVLRGWWMRAIPFRRLNRIPFSPISTLGSVPALPMMYKYVIDIKSPADTFLNMKGWTKGVVAVNGFNIGRYWPTWGPLCTLYIPGPFLRPGKNYIIILELYKAKYDLTISLTNSHDFSCTQSSVPTGLTKVDNQMGIYGSRMH